MRRADRLFRIVQFLRGRRLTTAAQQLAKWLQVSERTISRDVRDLSITGTPIEGDALGGLCACATGDGEHPFVS